MAATRRFMVGVLGTGLMAWRVAAAETFHIEPGDLTETLNDWSRQAQTQMLFEFTTVHGHRSAALDCECTPGEALRRLLEGSPFIYEFMNSRTVAVAPPIRPAMELIDSATLEQWMRRFEYVAQVYAEGAGPPVAPLTVTWGEDRNVIAAQR